MVESLPEIVAQDPAFQGPNQRLLDSPEQCLKLARSKERSHEFDQAVKVLEHIVSNHPDSEESETAEARLPEARALAREKAVYERINRNARRVLTEIGVDLSESEELMNLLIEADAIDFENENALFVPLKADHIEQCLARAPRHLIADPGPNAFGTGGTPPFLRRPGQDDLRAASAAEFEEIIHEAANWADVVKILSVPVQTDKSMSDFECAKVMDRHFHGLKMISTKKMTDEQAAFLSGKVDWLDGTTLMTCLRPMATMVEPFLRSVRAGNQLLFLDLTISGASGPGTPESLLTMIHAQELFMIVVAQTVNPGVTCVHGGIPGIMDSSGDLSYSALSQPLINAAMARLNRWVTGLPSAQSGGSSSLAEDVLTAAEESEASRATMRKYGVHIVRHSLGAMGNLNFFSLEKFKEDCRREREARYGRTSEVEPALWSLYFPEDDQAMEAIRELGEKGNPRSTDHTLRNVGVFDRWVEDLTEHDHQRGLVPDEALVAA